MSIAGKKMLDMMKARGGSEQDYSDEVLGTVLSVSPLQIWIDAKQILTEDFLELSALVQENKIHVSLPVSSGGKAEGEITLWRGLQDGDTVRMLRVQKGQRFIVLERTWNGV